MQRILSLLLVFVFLQTQVWAQFGNATSATSDTVGTFAGVLTPDGGSGSAIVTAAGIVQDNALGVFSVGVPQVGLAQGVFAYFDAGKTYIGTIVGVADPERMTLRALVKAQFDVSQDIGGFVDLTTGQTTGVTLSSVTGQANGSLDARIKSSNSGGFINNSVSIRIDGDASLDVQSVDPTTNAPTGPVSQLRLKVDGYKQSTDVNTSVDLSALSSSSSTGP